MRATGGNQVRVYADGKLAPRSESGWLITGPYPEPKRPLLVPVITIEKLYPCGWRKVPAQQENPDPYFVEYALQHGTAVSLEVRVLEDQNLIKFHVDNRGGDEAILALGQQKRQVFAEAQTEYGRGHHVVSFDLPDCSEGAIVRWDDQEIGRLDLDTMPPYSEILVDPTGRRCYVYRVINYQTAEGRRQFAGLPLSGPVSTRLRPQHIHQLPIRLFYFMERAPNRTGTSSPWGEAQGELRDSPCH